MDEQPGYEKNSQLGNNSRNGYGKITISSEYGESEIYGSEVSQRYIFRITDKILPEYHRMVRQFIKSKALQPMTLSARLFI